MHEIVKVQCPLSPPDGDWLIYDRRRRHQCLLPSALVPASLRETMDSEYKIYMMGKWNRETRTWDLGAKVPGGEW